jgi:hypothetical protein
MGESMVQRAAQSVETLMPNKRLPEATQQWIKRFNGGTNENNE